MVFFLQFLFAWLYHKSKLTNLKATKYSKKFKILRLIGYDVLIMIALIGNVASFRGFWNVLDVYFLPSKIFCFFNICILVMERNSDSIRTIRLFLRHPNPTFYSQIHIRIWIFQNLGRSFKKISRYSKVYPDFLVMTICTFLTIRPDSNPTLCYPMIFVSDFLGIRSITM